MEAIGLLCWLLLTLAVFALPAFVGVIKGARAHDTGAGLTLAAGHLLITFVRPMWLKLILGNCLRRAGGDCLIPRHA